MPRAGLIETKSKRFIASHTGPMLRLKCVVVMLHIYIQFSNIFLVTGGFLLKLPFDLSQKSIDIFRSKFFVKSSHRREDGCRCFGVLRNIILNVSEGLRNLVVSNLQLLVFLQRP